ncbi:hypothetical protein [Chitinophaga sp. CF418]|uniref:hypothetical protein n=1 Tax=Chitinophaga sp. CF418 TaxID=1855287 RepID=UPI00122D1187|nr:hypothetical protein [Chitinophaga sp. CF418]
MAHNAKYIISPWQQQNEGAYNNRKNEEKEKLKRRLIAYVGLDTFIVGNPPSFFRFLPPGFRHAILELIRDLASLRSSSFFLLNGLKHPLDSFGACCHSVVIELLMAVGNYDLDQKKSPLKKGVVASSL